MKTGYAFIFFILVQFACKAPLPDHSETQESADIDSQKNFIDEEVPDALQLVKFEPDNRDAWKIDMQKEGQRILETIYTDPDASKALADLEKHELRFGDPLDKSISTPALEKKVQYYETFLKKIGIDPGVDYYNQHIGDHIKHTGTDYQYKANSNAVDLYSRAENIRKSYLTAMTAVSWELDSGKPSAAYNINDPDRKLFRFFQAYVPTTDLNYKGSISTLDKLTDKSIGDSKQLKSLKQSYLNQTNLKDGKNLFVYDRSASGKSSHLKQDYLKSRQMGVDMRFRHNWESLDVLPHNKKHIIIGEFSVLDGSKRTYFKMEENGLGTLGEKAKHGINYVGSIFSSGKSKSPDKVYHGEKTSKGPIKKKIELLAKNYKIDKKHTKTVMEMGIALQKAGYSDTHINLIMSEELGPEFANWKERLGGEINVNYAEKYQVPVSNELNYKFEAPQFGSDQDLSIKHKQSLDAPVKKLKAPDSIDIKPTKAVDVDISKTVTKSLL